ncbi:MAG: PH domain-containing protein [Candidatus Nitrosopolaris sp.]
MSPVEPRAGEKRILDEDCAEDNLKNGILMLTNQRIIFYRTQGTLLTLSKKTEEATLDIPLDKIASVKTEGFIATKLVLLTNGSVYKFSVYSNRKWAKAIENQIKVYKSSI